MNFVLAALAFTASHGAVCSLRFRDSWPHCENVNCLSKPVSAAEVQRQCLASKDCDGFSFPKASIDNGTPGTGCLKKGCTHDKWARNGFGKGSHGYYLCKGVEEPAALELTPTPSKCELRLKESWPHCENVKCLTTAVTVAEAQKACLESEDCDGFSFPRASIANNETPGTGCLKKGCTPEKWDRKGFGSGSHGYYLCRGVDQPWHQPSTERPAVKPVSVTSPTRVSKMCPVKDKGMSYIGYDIFTFWYVWTELDCELKCEDEAKCNYWTWDAVNIKCQLKSSNKWRVPKKDHYSGSKRCGGKDGKGRSDDDAGSPNDDTPFTYKLSVVEGSPVVVAPDTVLRDFLVSNNMKLRMDDAAVASNVFEDLTVGELANKMGGSKKFEEKVKLKKQPPVTTKQKEENTKVKNLKAKIEKAEALRKEAFENSDPTDPDFDKKWAGLKAKYGMPQSFAMEGINSASTFQNAATTLNGYINEMDKMYADAIAAPALPDIDPTDRILEIVNQSKVPGIIFTKIGRPAPISGKEDATEQYMSESHYKWSNTQHFAQQSRTAVSVNAQGGGPAGAAVIGASAGFQGQWSRGQELNSAELMQEDFLTAVVSKTRSSQIYSFKVAEMKLNKVAMEGLSEIERTLLVEKNQAGAEAKMYKWLETYPIEVLKGPYGVGGTFEMVFNSRAQSKVQGSQLVDLAMRESTTRFSLGLAGATATGVGGLGVGVGTSNGHATAVNDGKRDAKYSVTTSWKSTFIGPKVNDPNSVERILASNPNVWRIIPAIGKGMREFQDMYSILRLTIDPDYPELDLKVIEPLMRKMDKQRKASMDAALKAARARLADEKRKREIAEAERKKREEYMRIPVVRNRGNSCWSSCGHGGKCLYCGREGLCCRQHYYDSGCGRHSGCHWKHCCVHKEGEWGRRSVIDLGASRSVVNMLPEYQYDEPIYGLEYEYEGHEYVSAVDPRNEKLATEIASLYYLPPLDDELFKGKMNDFNVLYDSTVSTSVEGSSVENVGSYESYVLESAGGEATDSSERFIQFESSGAKLMTTASHYAIFVGVAGLLCVGATLYWKADKNVESDEYAPILREAIA